MDARSPRRRAAVTLALLVLLTATLGGCGGDGNRPGARQLPGDEVVVASFNFAESRLVGEIYAEALEQAGIPVRREIDLGPRELVQPALLDGLVDLVPEYLGTALASLDPDTTVDRSDPVAVRRELERALQVWNVEVRDPAPAQNPNGFAVTRGLAERLGLRTLSDLARVASRLKAAGPPECPRRPFCLAGLERVYGAHFAAFLPFEGEDDRITALREEVVDVAVVFTTDGQLATGDLVLMEDDRRLQPAENLVPVVSSRAGARYGPRLAQVIDAVSGRLTSNSLIFLNWRVGVAGKDVAAEARGWLRRQMPVPAPG